MAKRDVMKQRRAKSMIFLAAGLLLVAFYVGVTWRQTRQQRVSHDLIDAVKRLDVEGTAEALHRGANSNARSAPNPGSRLMHLLERWYRSDVYPLSTETALNEALLAHSAPYKTASYAEDFVKTRIVQLLLDAGANPNTPYRGGDMPLAVASGECPASVVRLLLDHHTDVNAVGTHIKPALIMAALCRHPDTVKLLLQRGADVNARNENGLTALMCASANDYVDIETALLDAHADVTPADVNGRTALKYAQLRGFPASIRLLKQHGALK